MTHRNVSETSAGLAIFNTLLYWIGSGRDRLGTDQQKHLKIFESCYAFKYGVIWLDLVL